MSCSVLFYVLFRQGRSIEGLGLDFSWKQLFLDLLTSFGLIVISYVAVSVVYVVTIDVYHALGLTIKEPIVEKKAMAPFLVIVLLMFLNGFFEELIARAYVITEIFALTGRRWLAVLVSVVGQAAYHLYQGVPAAISTLAIFLVFSLYYVKKQRIMPVILAHALWDVYAFYMMYANQSMQGTSHGS